jgi:uncharacterized protein YgiM (DUF1202 family)
MTKRYSVGISIVLILFLLVVSAGCDETSVNGMGTAPPPSAGESTATGASEATTEDTMLPQDTSSVSPTDTAESDSTATISPGGSSTISPTDTPDTSASPVPTSGLKDSDSMSVGPVVGKANVSEHLTLRKTASADGESLAQIPKDGEFTVLQVETGKKWLKVKYDDKTGYVQAKYVSIGSGDDRVCTVFCNSALNVRDGAGTSHKVIGSVASGTTLVVKAKLSVSGKTWYKVEIGASTGYVIAQYCRIAES